MTSILRAMGSLSIAQLSPKIPANDPTPSPRQNMDDLRAREVVEGYVCPKVGSE